MGRRFKIVVVDYGLGNTRSVVNAIERLGYGVELSASPASIEGSDALVLPGVGAFGEAMRNLRESGLIEVLEHAVLERRLPILGICLGMQILADSSCENGIHQGLGWIPGQVVQFQAGPDLAIPHVGWNEVKATAAVGLFDRLGGTGCFYFDHSYHFECESQYVCARCSYGDRFVAAVRRANVFGVQFHPEKSQSAGLKLFRGFFEEVCTRRA